MARGRRPLPWIKLWFDIIGDPKIAQLSAGEKWCWVGLLLLAGQSPVRGKLMLTESKPMDETDIYRALRLSQKERNLLKTCIIKMVDMGSLKWNSTTLEVIHFRDRQETFPSDLIDYHKKTLLINSELTPDSLRINSELSPDLLQKEVEGRGERKDTPLSKDKGARSDEQAAATGALGEISSEKKPTSLARGGRKKPGKADPSILEIFTEMRSYLGYPDKVKEDPIPTYGREGQAIKRLLARGFTREEILSCWRSKVSQRGGEFVSLTWVNEDISKKEGRLDEHRENRKRPGVQYARRPPGPTKPGKVIDGDTGEITYQG